MGAPLQISDATEADLAGLVAAVELQLEGRIGQRFRRHDGVFATLRALLPLLAKEQRRPGRALALCRGAGRESKREDGKREKVEGEDA